MLENAADGQDELRFMRVRTKRHELIITPGELILAIRVDRKDERYLLVVLQDPGQ